MGKDEGKTKTIKDGTEKMQIRRVRNGNDKKKNGTEQYGQDRDFMAQIWMKGLYG